MGRRNGSFKALKNTGLILFLDSHAMIPNRKNDAVAIICLAGNAHRLTRSILNGIGDEIDDDLLEAELIPVSDHRAFKLEINMAASTFELSREPLNHFMHELAKI